MEQSSCRVRLVLNDAACFTLAPDVINVLDGGETAASEVLSRAHHPLQCFTALTGAGPVPHCDAARQHTLDDAPVEVCEDLSVRTKLLQLPQEVESLPGFLDHSVCM